MTTIPIGGQFYESDSLPISAQECVNFYANIPQTETYTVLNLFNTPGITQEVTAGIAPNRGGHVFQGQPYVVNGNALFRIDRSVDPIGNVSYSSVNVSGDVEIDGTQRVIMADNGREAKTANTLVQISDMEFDGPVNDVNYVDGYFLFTKKNSQRFFISGLRDGLSYRGSDSSDAEADPDNVVRAFILNNEPIIFGTETFETFQNIGGAGFPFQRVEGGIQARGLVSRFAVTEINHILMFLGAGTNETPAIWLTEGGRPQKLSTTAIDNRIAEYSQDILERAFAWHYGQEGAFFVGFTFPTKDTFVYDLTAQKWHTRESTADDAIMAAYSGLMVGDELSENIGFLSRDVFTEFGNPIKRRFVTPQLDNEGYPFWVDRLEVWGDQGIGTISGQGDPPEILMSFSNDGGRVFSNSLKRDIGRIGDYTHRTVWNSLGRISRQICFRFEMSDPVKWSFAKLEAEIESERSA